MIDRMFSERFKVFIIVVISFFPFHALLVPSLGLPNYWRQAVSYILAIIVSIICLHRYKNHLDKTAKTIIILSYTFFTSNIAGLVVGIFQGVSQDILLNSFLISIGFFPIMFLIYFLGERTFKFMHILYFSSVIIALGGIYEQITGNRIVPQEYQSLNNILSGQGVYRVGSFFGDALTLGPFLAFVFIIGVTESRRINIWLKICCQIILLAGIFVSGVRSAYVILAFGVVFSYFLFARNKKRPLFLEIKAYLKHTPWVLAGIGLASLLIFSGDIFNGNPVSKFYEVQYVRVVNTFDLKSDKGNMGRVYNYSNVLDEISVNPETLFFGVGYGLSTNYNPNLVRSRSRGFSAENQYLKALYEQGILGLFGLLIFMIAWFSMIKNIRNFEKKQAMMVIFAMTAMHMLFVPTLNSPNLSYLVFAFVGISAHRSKERNIVKCAAQNEPKFEINSIQNTSLLILENRRRFRNES